MFERISRWFRVSGVVERREYFLTGAGLMLLKYALDASAVYVANREWFTPAHYFNPSLGSRGAVLHGGHTDVVIAMIVWSLPFIWIGVAMTMRRARDAGLSPWLALVFFVPGAGLLLAAALCMLPSAPEREHAAQEAKGLGSALLGLALSGAIVLAMIPVAVYGKGSYGWSLFVGTPFVQGVITGYLYNRRGLASIGSNIGVITVGLLVIGGAVLLLAIEGLVCLVMALPLAWLAAVLGMVLGRSLAKAGHTPGNATGSFALLPVLALAEPRAEREVFEVVSSVEIAAPPEVVWEHLVAVSELPPPHEQVFAVGLAYPQRAVIDGEGVGAIRRCEFSTGAFVEPITVWDRPHRLSFDVASQPPPMQEWSPYRHVHPPHLDGYFRSVHGEFRLVAIDGGTRLEGSTWYELDVLPRAYWRHWADFVIGSIHERVLTHIATTAEAAVER